MTIKIEEYQQIKDIDSALNKLFSYISKTNSITTAVDFALKAHENQFRKSGEPYITHPILVASLVAQITGDEDMCISALLHDVVEDTNCNIEDIKQKFGNDISCMVEGLTKIDTLKKNHISCNYDEDYDETQLQNMHSAVNLRKVFFQETHNEKVFTIKLCDRLHNLSTLDAMPPAKQIKIAQESLIVYAPIAHRLGISSIKNFIEDFSFKYINPQRHDEIQSYLDNYSNSNNFKDFKDDLTNSLTENGFIKDDLEITGRTKHIYSTHMKMQKDGIPVSEILDIFALRIITQNRLDCYKALGIIHKKFKPIISKFKDYISLPKENGYQTIHTTVLSPFGTYEIQIRTKDMHQIAEHGIASHWKYKGLDSATPNLNWFQNLEYKDSEISEFKDLVLHDLYTETVEVFSPDSKVFSLPRGSIALDFAYAIHSDVGNFAKKVFINNIQSSFLQELHSGDIIRIEKGEKLLFHCTYLDIVKTSKAKKDIRQMCAKRLKQKDTDNAYNILCTFFDKNKENINKLIEKEKYISTHVEQISFNLSIFKNAINIIQNELLKQTKFSFLNHFKKLGIKQSNINNFIIYYKKIIKNASTTHCCRAKVGENIVGFIQNNKVVVHHKMCQEAKKLILQNTQSVFIQWDITNIKQYKIILKLDDTKGALTSMLSVMNIISANISSIKLSNKESKNKNYCKIKFNSKVNKEVIENKLSKKGYFVKNIRLLKYKEKTY